MAFLLVIALPIIVVAAVKLSPTDNSGGGFGDGDLDLVGLATTGASNFAVTMLLFSSGFLLLIIAALFFGDTIASEASWSTLRYLLIAPVPRLRLLRTKIVVGLILTAGVLVTLVLFSWVIGAIFFGLNPLGSPLGGTFTSSESLGRLTIITVYIGLTLLFPAGLAFLTSTLTDIPLGAVGTAVVIVIIFNILDAIEVLGDFRRFLPTDYGASWIGALSPEIAWSDMIIGATYNVTAFIVLLTCAAVAFQRKDITS
jgi:ABC-2 type transport system permease protein